MSGGNCPETPRQKMIGMMYLMLTAMLALNVSGDLLNAFTIVDQSIRNQTKSTDEKLGLSFYNFEAKAEQNPARVKPKYELALDVKAKADSLVNLIQSFKNLIIVTADGEILNPECPEDGLQNKSDQDKAAQIMIVEQGGARGEQLKNALNQFREDMIAAMQQDTTIPVDSTLLHSISSMINTADGFDSESGEKLPWVNQQFEHLPIAASLGLMSAMQSNVRNVETDVVNHLYKSIDAASFKFNTLIPLIIPEAQYVIQGGQYKADIMLAAYDDTMEPIVYVGDSQIPVEGGRGKYQAAASSVGMKTYSAKLQVPDPLTGKLVDYPVVGNYEVGAPSLVVSAIKMNAMYRGLPNPIEVSVAGVSPSALRVSATGGTLTKSGNAWVCEPSSAKEIQINVSADMGGGKIQNFGHKTFRVYDVPDPVITFTGANKGRISKSKLKSCQVEALLKDFVMDAKFTVKSFTLSIIKGGFTQEQKVEGTNGKLDDKAIKFLQGVSRNGKVYVEAVKAVGPDGRERSLNGLDLTMD